MADEKNETQYEYGGADETRHDRLHRRDRHRVALVRRAFAYAEEGPEDRLGDLKRACFPDGFLWIGHELHPAFPSLPATWKNVYDMVT